MQLFTREGFFFSLQLWYFKDFLFNNLPNSLNCFQTELNCHPNSLRKVYGYVSLYWKMQAFGFEKKQDCVSMHKGPEQGAEVPALPPSITMDARKLWCFLYKPESERVPQLDCVMLNRLLNNLCLSVCEPETNKPPFKVNIKLFINVYRATSSSHKEVFIDVKWFWDSPNDPFCFSYPILFFL